MPPLPRSALLSLWAAPVLAGRRNAGALMRAVQGDDEPHEIAVADATGLGPVPAPGRLPELLGALAAQHVRALRLVLPVPGDPSALPGPVGANEVALQAQECVVTVGGPPLLLVPEVVEFGSVYEVGHLVTWQVLDCSVPVAPVVTSLGEAERELREALLTATEMLRDLDVASWRDEVADRVDEVRQATASGTLPDHLSARAVRVLDLAWRVRLIVDLAGQDDGGAVNGWEATRRFEVLRRLDSVGRRALVAAVNDRLTVPY